MLEIIKEILVGTSDPYVSKAYLGLVTAGLGLAQAAMGYDWGGKRRAAVKNAKAAYEEQKAVYRDLDTSNVYKDLKNQYEGLENTAEDLTVNKQQAEFERQMFQQSQANTMQALSGAAGGSGIAGLAQAMSNQAMTQSQKTAAAIGKQEAQNRLLLAQQASKNQQLEAAGQTAVDALRGKGELQSMQMEQSKQATILGMDAQAFTGAQAAQMQGEQQVMSGLSTAASSLMPGFGKDGKFNLKNIK